MNHLLRAAFARLLMLRCQPPSPWIIVLSTLIWALAMHCASALAQTPQPSTTRYEYDVNGNITRIVDPLGRATVRRYDSLNRLIEQQQQPAPASGAPQPTIGYSYDARSQLMAVKDPRGLSTHYAIDGLGQETALASPDTGLATRTFDAAGHHTSTSDARGQSTTFERDALGRVTRIVYASRVPSSFEYDTGSPGAVGRLSKMTDESGQTDYLYDAAGRLVGKTVTIASAGARRTFTLGYAYGESGPSNGKLTGMTYPSGTHVSFEYDQYGRISGMSVLASERSKPTVLLSDIAYHPSGAAQSWIWGNSTPAAPNHYFRDFDLQGRVTRLPLGNVLNGGVIRTIFYDAAGRLTRTEHAGHPQRDGKASTINQSYVYDELDRLSHFTGHGTMARYQYDANGNRTQLGYGGQSFINTINPANNQMQRITGPQTIKQYVYNAVGNLITDGTINYDYSARGRLRSARSGKIIAKYSHNGLDQRVLKMVKTGSSGAANGDSTYFIYDEHAQLIGEHDASGLMLAETIYLGNLPVAVLKRGNEKPMLASTIHYVYSDQLHAPRVITNSSDNQIVWRWDLADPFGASQPDEMPNGHRKFSYNLRFPGQYYDQETNVHYNYHRNYDPQTGRFLESDPIGLSGGINTYGYVLNNPLIFSDPLGLDATRVLNTASGRKFWHGPTNGNWGGKCWSGGTYSCGPGGKAGNLPPTDSGDACYKLHDECYDSPTCNTPDTAKNQTGVRQCNEALKKCLRNLPEDPKLWPEPPKPGTETDTQNYREGALSWF